MKLPDVLAVLEQLRVSVIKAAHDQRAVITDELELVAQLRLDPLAVLHLLPEALLRETQGFRASLEISQCVLLGGGVLHDSLVYEFDLLQTFGQPLLLGEDLADPLSILGVLADSRPDESHDYLLNLCLEGRVVRLVLLVVGPASLVLDDLVHLVADSFFYLAHLHLAHLLIGVDELATIIGLRDTVVLPLLLEGTRHGLGRRSLCSTLVLGLSSLLSALSQV